MGSILCPTCGKSAKFDTKIKGDTVSFSMKCVGCNRRVIKNGRRDDFNTLRRIAIETWQGAIDTNQDGEDNCYFI